MSSFRTRFAEQEIYTYILAITKFHYKGLLNLNVVFSQINTFSKFAPDLTFK